MGARLLTFQDLALHVFYVGFNRHVLEASESIDVRLLEKLVGQH